MGLAENIRQGAGLPPRPKGTSRSLSPDIRPRRGFFARHSENSVHINQKCGTLPRAGRYFGRVGLCCPLRTAWIRPLAGTVLAPTTRTIPCEKTARIGDEGKPPFSSSGPAACCLNFSLNRTGLLCRPSQCCGRSGVALHCWLRPQPA
jgi:hypothetical protein